MVACPQQSRGGQPESLGKVRAENPGAWRRLERAEGQLSGGGSCRVQVWKGLPQAHPLQPRGRGARPGSRAGDQETADGARSPGTL